MYTKTNNPLVSYSNVDWVGDSTEGGLHQDIFSLPMEL